MDKVEAGLALLDHKDESKPENKPMMRPIGGRDMAETVMELVTSEGFLRSYVEDSCKSTDAPHIYHVGVGLSILGAAMGNKVRIQSYGGLTVFPNLFIVLIAPSGLMRKSTALYMGKNLLQEAVPMACLPDDWTPERLVDILTDNSTGLCVVSEFTRLIDQMVKKEYMGGAMQMLTELYDSPTRWVKERQKSKRKEIEEPAVSLLGATTLEWLEESVKAKDLRGGFLARFLFLPATKRGPRVKLKSAVRHHVRLKQRDWLRNVAELKGEADFSAVFDIYEDWLYNYEKRAERKMWSDDRHADLIGLYSRTGVTALKLAMIFQASRSPQLRVSPEAMKDAIEFLSYVHQTTVAVSKRFSDSWDERQQKRVIECLVKHGGVIPREELYRAMRIDSRKLDQVMVTLREQGRVEISRQKAEGAGRPTTIYSFIRGD